MSSSANRDYDLETEPCCDRGSNVERMTNLEMVGVWLGDDYETVPDAVFIRREDAETWAKASGFAEYTAAVCYVAVDWRNCVWHLDTLPARRTTSAWPDGVHPSLIEDSPSGTKEPTR